jgi:hypothetical protein
VGRVRGQATAWSGSAHLSHCLRPDSEGLIDVDWRKQPGSPLDCTVCTLDTVGACQEDSTGFVRDRAGPCLWSLPSHGVY